LSRTEHRKTKVFRLRKTKNAVFFCAALVGFRKEGHLACKNLLNKSQRFAFCLLVTLSEELHQMNKNQNTTSSDWLAGV